MPPPAPLANGLDSSKLQPDDAPKDLALTSPSSRQIVQRDAANVGSIPLAGSYTGAPGRIEARAVVMSAAGNSGRTTDWQTITNAPTGGVFSGKLGKVSAGGWYQLEVRSVTGETPGNAVVVEKIGVGDIYVTCGQSFPQSGFRAVLWHQGESDAIANITTATHASRLNSVIVQSRTDAGWAVPWYVAEASFHPATTLSQEEPVTAGPRQVVHGDPRVFLGPTTDSYHLEDANGGKLVDTVHFNNAGLLDHAGQWRDILCGTATLTPRNADFEENRTPSITGHGPLADGGSCISTITETDSPLVIGWRILSASGNAAADGSNGYHNPSAGTYAAAVDTMTDGVLPHMTGRHVAKLDGGSARNLYREGWLQARVHAGGRMLEG